MKIKIKITMENAAFEDRNGMELCRILRKFCEEYHETDFSSEWNGPFYDVNGNKVGTWEVTD